MPRDKLPQHYISEADFKGGTLTENDSEALLLKATDALNCWVFGSPQPSLVNNPPLNASKRSRQPSQAAIESANNAAATKTGNGKRARFSLTGTIHF